MTRGYVLLILISLALSIIMTVISAYIRISDSGIGCEPWPACFPATFQLDDVPGITVTEHDSNKALRVMHRLMASVFGILVLLLFTLTIWQRGSVKRPIIRPALLLILTIALAVVGLNTPDVAHPIVTTINLTGGMALSAILCWLLVGAPRPETEQKFHSTSRYWIPTAIFFTAIAIVSGAWTSANFAAASCNTLLSCDIVYSFEQAFNPERTLTFSEGKLTGDQNQPLILITHVVVASVMLAITTLALYLHARRTGEILYPLAGILGLIVLISIALHIAPNVTLASLHNVLAIILMLLLIRQYHHD